MLEKQKSNISSSNKIKTYTNDIQPVDPTLNLPEKNMDDQINPVINPKINIVNNKQANIKQRLSMEILRQMLKDQTIPIEEKEKINKLIDEVRNNDYYLSYADLNGANQELMTNFNQNNEVIEKPGLLNFPDTLDYDIEFYKLGRKCHGLKGRKAIIKNGKLYSSDKPLKEIKEKDWEKMKEKTEFLQNAEIIKEEKDEPNRDKREWSSKDKNYRIIINYTEPVKKEPSSFFLYFNEKKQMKEVELAFYNLSKPETFKTEVKSTIDKFSTLLLEGKKLYTILKVLSVKNKIKKRKAIFNKVETSIKSKIKAKFNEEFLNAKIVGEEISELNIGLPSIRKEEPSNLEAGKKFKSDKDIKIMPFKYNEIPISNFMPWITNDSTGNKNENENIPIKRSLQDMINKYNSLQNEIPNTIIKEPNEEILSEEGVCFGVKDKIYVMNFTEEKTNFSLNQENCDNVKYILFDKNKPEIIFKNDNGINDIDENNLNLKQNVLNEDNIYEISNVIKNVNNYMTDNEDNNLIILGPKIDNDKGINYKYKNNINDICVDPENLNIKTKTINIINNKKIEGLTFQIYHIKLNINDKNIENFKLNLTGSINEDINAMNLLFGYTIKFSPLKQIDGPLIKPKQYEQNICFIEYNNQYFIPKEYLINNQEIIIETYCIPITSFSKGEDKIPSEQLNYMAKFLSPVKIGFSKISLKNIKSGKYEYEIIKEGIPLSNSFILIDGMEEKIDSIKLKNNFEGKDYVIGGESYVIKKINKNFVENVKQNKNISDEIKDKYFNVCFDTKEEKEFLLRPDENMNENDFIREISQQVSDEDCKKILNNKKYTYLPQCEKFVNRETFFNNKNFNCLTEEQKEYLCDNKYNEGDWIYTLPELNVKFLSKNLGVTQNNNHIYQKIYCTEEIQTFPLESLMENNKEKIIPITENNFNIFDFKELDNIDTNNYQWVTGIKFNNELQMNTFIKLLNLARQNINTKKRSKKETITFEEDKIEEFDSDKKNILTEKINDMENKKLNKVDVIIEYMEFIHDYNLTENHCKLDAKIFVEGLKQKTIIDKFEDKKYGFENSLKKSDIAEKKRKQVEDINDEKEIKIINFDKSIEVFKKKFNADKKTINCVKNSAEVDFDRDEVVNDDKYKLVINLEKEEFIILLKIHEYLNNTDSTIVELPLYKDKNNEIIIGKIYISFLEKYFNNFKSFQERYEENNLKYLMNPILLLKEDDFPSINNQFGLYEPNVYRRRLLNLIHKKKNIIIDPAHLDNYDKDEDNIKNLYDILYKECAALPEQDNFINFKLYNLKRNNSSNEISNSFRKKVGLKLLKVQSREKFMEIYRKNKWDAYLKYFKNILNPKENKENLTPYEHFTSINDKIFLFRTKEDGDKLNNLMYLGVHPEYREGVYSILLDLPKLYEETREVIFKQYAKDLKTPHQLYSFFADQLFNDPKRNIIFSLIDNDSNFLTSFQGSTLEEINQVKKIAKSFFIWSELRVGLNDKNDNYVYFIGLLTLTQQLFQNFKKEYFTFWALIGLAKNISHFHQKNPLFSPELNYINIFGLVTRLIMETHLTKIFDKFISLNIPPELFITKHLSTLFTDYFKGNLMMRILDVIVFESSVQGIYSDDLQYLRILCAIPLTLFEFNESQILACKSVSEIESIINDLFLHTFNKDKFINKLGENINKYYVMTSFLEKWIFNNKGREWDTKRGDLENLMKRHFYPIFEENKNYLLNINIKLKQSSEEIIENLFNDLDSKLNSIKSLYLQGTSDYDDSVSFMGINLQISKLIQIYNNENTDINEYKLDISFGDRADSNASKFESCQFDINFDNQKNEIINIQDLFYKTQFKNDQCPRYIHFSLSDKIKQNRATFSYKILNYEPMKLSKIILENKEDTNKFFLEFILFKTNNKTIPSDDLALFNNIFSPPEYYNSNKIEEKLYSYNVSGYNFNKEITKIIQIENDNKNLMMKGAGFDQNMVEMFKKLNNNAINEDCYNSEKIINKKNKNVFNEKISQKILKIIDSLFQDDLSNIVKKWLGDTNISFEELLYSIILVDKYLVSVNEKLFLLFSIAQMRDKLLLNTDYLSIDKLKEMIYSLYKRFRIYFSKTDIERMIDFILKDERLFNIKYAFVHNKNDEEKINEIIYDKDYYESKINSNKKIFEIYFDDISKELNIFLNHLNNHYNINTFSPKLISYIYTCILNNKDLKQYSNYNFDTITLVVEKDNILYKRIYSIKYSPLKISEIKSGSYYINSKYEDDITSRTLCAQLANLDINNSYSLINHISFEKFKEIFFKLPYLSDLFRVSLSYLSKDMNNIDKEFQSFKIIVGHSNDIKGIFYFPQKTAEDDLDNNYDAKIQCDMKYKVGISDTVDFLINLIINKIKNNKIKLTNEEKNIIECLQSFDRIKCSVWYDAIGYQSGKIMQECINYFETLYSCLALKNKNKAEIHIIYDNDKMSLDSKMSLILKKEGYCKIYCSNNDDFIWKKCKIKNKNKIELNCVDYKTNPRIIDKNEDVVLSYDI